MNWETYISFGDSITIGARTYLGYPEYAISGLEIKTDKSWNLINHSISGITTIELLRSIDDQLEKFKDVKPSVCTLLVGTNDVKNNTGNQEFEIAYNLLLTKIKIITGIKMIKVFEIPEFFDGVMYPYTLDMNQKIREFNSIIHLLSNKHHLRCFSLGLNKEDFFDGIHLNEEGCKKAGRIVSEIILSDRGL